MSSLLDQIRPLAKDRQVAHEARLSVRSDIERVREALGDELRAQWGQRDMARVRQRLRRLGLRRRHWTTKPRPVIGWASLTSTERTISELVAQGLTNQQAADQMFVSVHTVAFHGITSRTELRAALRPPRDTEVEHRRRPMHTVTNGAAQPSCGKSRDILQVPRRRAERR